MNPWIAIVGTREAGRHALAERLSSALRADHMCVSGFLHQPVDGPDGSRVGYDLVDAAGGERMPLARESSTPRICSWGFDDAAFATAHAWSTRDSDVAFMELGRLEAAEEGHWPTVLSVLRGPPRLLVLGLRPNVVAPIAMRLPDPEDSLELPADEADEDAFLARVVELAAARRSS